MITSLLAAVTSVSFVACGPSVELDDGTGGNGGSGAGAGMSTSSGMTLPDTPTLVATDLGSTPLNVLRAFDVPEHALGVTAIVEAPSIDKLIGISRLRAPSGDYVTFNFSVMGKSNFAFARQGWVGGASVQSDLPQAWPVQSGSWRILLGSDGPLESANVRMFVRKTADGVFHGGVVDVNLFAVPNGAPPDYLDFVVAGIFKDYAGLSLGNVEHSSLDAAFSTIETEDQYRALLSASVDATSTPVLNVFVINKFGADFGKAIGVAGGIPGSATINGTTISGVAYQPSGVPEQDVTVLRHEIGHLAGLFHTTEFATEDTDPINDTVECPVATIQSTPEQCPDTVNLMFPIVFPNASTNTELTAAQVRVIQGSALYRGVYEAGGAPDPASNAVAPQPSYKPESSFYAVVRSDKHMPSDPTPLERVLGGVWCAHAHADYEALAARVAGASTTELRRLVLDESRPDFLRTRALGVYARFAVGTDRQWALDLAKELTLGMQNSTSLRLGALDTLERFDIERAREMARVSSVTTNPVLRRTSQRILAK